MSNTPALTRKDMREPDRFQNVATQAAAWLAARKKLLAIVGGAVVLLVVALGVISAVQESREQKAGLAVSGLLALTQAPVSEAAVNPNEKFFKTDDEKNQALLAEAGKILEAHGVNKVTVLAILTQGNAQLGLKQWDAATQAYERFLKEAPADDSMRPLALENLGLVAEGKGDLAAAATAYERMAKEAPEYSDRADLDRARVLAANGKAAEAKQLLEKFGENHKDSVLSSKASTALQKLGAK